MPDDDSNPSVERELQQARQALDDAAKARDADLSDAAVINRLYYAAFHAIQAVLYDRGFEPTTHGGVLSSSAPKSSPPATPHAGTAGSTANSRNSANRPTMGTTNSMRTLMRSTHEPSNSSPIWKPSAPPTTNNVDLRTLRRSRRLRDVLPRGDCVHTPLLKRIQTAVSKHVEEW